MRTTDTHVYFYGQSDRYSNWNNCHLTDPITGMYFHNTEQAFMWQKANFFRDNKITQLAGTETNPREVKKLGRMVAKYDDKLWTTVKFGYMVYVNYLKFKQNAYDGLVLITTGNKILVEASPYDCIWGVGLGQDDDLILDEKNWKGQNLLGKALMEVRNILKTN